MNNWAAAVMCILLFGCTEDRSPSNSFALTDLEASQLMTAADGGDVEAMKRLALFYGINQQDVTKEIAWLERAAEAGDSEARDSVLGYYEDSDSVDQRRHGEELRKKWREQ